MSTQEIVDKINVGLEEIPARAIWLRDDPVPLIALGAPEADEYQDYSRSLGGPISLAILSALRPRGIRPTYRCVSVDRLPTVLSAGCDVEPTDAPMYVTPHLEKALEYGGSAKAIQVFDTQALSRTYVEVSADLDPKEREELSKSFPTALMSIDESKVWLSRLPEDHPSLGKAYEIEYMRYISGDPFEALMMVLVVGLPKETAGPVAKYFAEQTIRRAREQRT